MGTTNCVNFMFQRQGVVVIETIDVDLNKLEEQCFVVEGIEDFKTQDEAFVIYTDPSVVLQVAEEFEKQGYKVLSSQAEMVPQNFVEIDEDKMDNFEKLLDKLDDNDDVQDYYHNVKL